MKTEALEQAKNHVKSFLAHGKSTMDLFSYFTRDAPEPFLEPVSNVFIFVFDIICERETFLF